VRCHTVEDDVSASAMDVRDTSSVHFHETQMSNVSKKRFSQQATCNSCVNKVGSGHGGYKMLAKLLWKARRRN
jgi:hypothetical protein